MTVTGHLKELRRRLFLSVIVYVALAGLSFAFIQFFVDAATGLSPQFDFVYLAPSELVMSYMKLALLLGLVFAAPFILWQAWAFIAPGLTAREKKSASAALVAGFFCFVIGMVFCYLLVLPMTLEFFYNFNRSTDIAATISFDSYMSFILGMLVAFGLVFEMPVLSFLLARLGILQPVWLVKGRKFAILIIFILAAIITPPDVVSQFMTGVPMIGLYELSIAVSKAAARQRERAEEHAEDAEAKEA